MFKYYVYKARENGSLDLKVLKRNIHKLKHIEKQISLNEPKKRKHFEQKWKLLLQKTHSTHFDMVVQQQLGWGRGNVVIFFSFKCCYFLY